MARIVGILVISLPFILSLNSGGCSGSHSRYIDTVACPLTPTVNRVPVDHPYYSRKILQKTKTFYEANDFRRVWFGPRGSRKVYRAFAEEVRNSRRYGMDPEAYHLANLEEEIETVYGNPERSGEAISALDIKVTASFFLFTTHLLEGRIPNPGSHEFVWKRSGSPEDDVSLLLNMGTASDIKEQLQQLHPTDPQYRRLQNALAFYRDLEKEDAHFPNISPMQKIRPGQTDRQIANIRKKLNFTDIQPGNVPGDPLRYDKSLVEAIKQFQKRHGLSTNGVIDSRTITCLNTSFKEKADIIGLNLERLRWQRNMTSRHHIMINIPEYSMRVYEQNKKVMEMRVVLGSEFNATPIFDDTLQYIVLSPTWNVPQSIFKEEFLPSLRKDPDYYSDGNFTFLKNDAEIDPAQESWKKATIDPKDYRVIQHPGPTNPLGKVKFMMPNNLSIYLHDTPSGRLFSQQKRAFSHGCIRLEKALEFAEYLLRDQSEWTRERILQAMDAQEPMSVKLEKEYPVYIVYRTAWVDEQGIVHFRSDLYGHDKRHLLQLQRSVEQAQPMSQQSLSKGISILPALTPPLLQDGSSGF